MFSDFSTPTTNKSNNSLCNSYSSSQRQQRLARSSPPKEVFEVGGLPPLDLLGPNDPTAATSIHSQASTTTGTKSSTATPAAASIPVTRKWSSSSAAAMDEDVIREAIRRRFSDDYYTDEDDTNDFDDDDDDGSGNNKRNYPPKNARPAAARKKKRRNDLKANANEVARQVGAEEEGAVAVTAVPYGGGYNHTNDLKDSAEYEGYFLNNPVVRRIRKSLTLMEMDLGIDNPNDEEEQIKAARATAEAKVCSSSSKDKISDPYYGNYSTNDGKFRPKSRFWTILLSLLMGIFVFFLYRSMPPFSTTYTPSKNGACFQEQDELRHAVSVLNYQFNQTRVEQVYNNYGDDMEDWCVGQLSNFSHVFQNQHHVEQVDLSQWDVSKATVMESMFDEAISFTGNIHNWHVSKVTSMRRMFHKAYAFNQDISQWDVSSVETMRHMFAHASSFNRPIGAWSTDSLSNVTGMFYHATAFNQDISQWEMSKVTDMAIMFAGATTFNQPLGDWDMSSVVSAEAMFLDATSFDQDLSQWNVSNMKFMQRMFENATSFKTNFSQWDFSSVTRMHRMFYGATNIHPVHSGLCDNPTFMALLQQDSWTMEDIFDNGQSCP